MIENLSFDAKSRVRKAAAHIAIEVDGQVMLMSESQGSYFGLDDIGSDIWRRLEKPQSLTELSASLACDYESSAEVIARDVAALLTALHGYGLLEVEDGSIAVIPPLAL